MSRLGFKFELGKNFGSHVMMEGVCGGGRGTNIGVGVGGLKE